MRWWGGAPDASCSGAFLLLGAYWVAACNLLPQNRLERLWNFLYYTAVFALVMPQRISNISRDCHKNKSSKTTIIKLFANHSSKKKKRKRESRPSGMWREGRQTREECDRQAYVRKECEVQVEIIVKKEFQYDTTTPKPENHGMRNFKGLEAITSFLYILRVRQTQGAF